MKTYEEMAHSALARGKAIRNQRNKINKIYIGVLSALTVCCLVILLAICIGEKEPDLHQDPPLSISLDSLAELDEMREMISCTDEELLSTYLRSISGGGARSRDDLIFFVNVMNSLPVLELIEGEITWISYSFDDSDREDDVVFISTVSTNGDWVRVEYLINETDVNAELNRRKAAGEFRQSTIDAPIQSSDGRIQVYSEKREAHPSGVGYTISWNVVVDGILTRVVYYSENIDGIQAENVFDDPTIGTLKSENLSR